MMKSSTLFERGPLPPYVHLAYTKRHSRDRCSQAFPIFHALPLPWTKNFPDLFPLYSAVNNRKLGGGLATNSFHLGIITILPHCKSNCLQQITCPLDKRC